MKLTERDKILVMLLPAILVVLAYGYFLGWKKLPQLNGARDALKTASAAAPSPAQIAAKRLDVNKLVQESQVLQGKLETLQKKWGYETAFCAAGSHRHERVEKLTNLLNKHHLSSMEDAEVESGGKDAKVSPSLESMIQKIGQLSGAPKPQLRRIRFHGRFVDVHRALDELATGQLLAIPVGLTMKSTGDLESREWTLLVWL